jgi:hypothetical protein
LQSKNICAHPNWRRADLLVIRNPSPVPLPDVSTEASQEIWETYLIGTQVVRLRLHPVPRKRKTLITPIPCTEAFIFDSVSARDKRRRFVDIWTSRNRVAVVGDVHRVRYFLSLLSNLSDLTPKAVFITLHSFLDHPEADALCRLLSADALH